MPLQPADFAALRKFRYHSPGMTAPLKTRFAPSPTGWLHLGNIRTALFNHLLAKGAAGRVFLLRIEDTDVMRGHDQYARALMQNLEWLGLGWDEGPGAPRFRRAVGAVATRHDLRDVFRPARRARLGVSMLLQRTRAEGRAQDPARRPAGALFGKVPASHGGRGRGAASSRAGARLATGDRNGREGFFARSLTAVEQLPSPDFQKLATALAQATGRKGKSLFQPLRGALTGELDGPEMARLLPLIGMERARKRLQRAREAARS